MKSRSTDNIELKIKESLSIRIRSYLSIDHILSSTLFSRLAYNIEKNHIEKDKPKNGKFNEKLYSEHRSYVLSSIISAISCLEANINEFFSDVCDGNANQFDCLDKKTKKLIKDMWQFKIPKTARYPILDKYSIALTLSGKNNFDTSSKIYGNIVILTKLRNKLIHHEPEWLDHEINNNKNLQPIEKQLKGKFELNPLTGLGNPFYPDKCLSHGCAEWSCKSCISFIDEFSNRMGIISPINHIRDRLATKNENSNIT